MQSRVTIVDYGRGNLFSIEQAVRHVGGATQITSDPGAVATAERLILPGVGAFGDAMGELANERLVEAVRAFADTGRPLLGICLGMQMLLSRSYEFGEHAGLDLIPGEVVRFRDPPAGGPFYKIPHISWCGIDRPVGISSWEGTILEGLDSGAHVYFVHSFTCVPRDHGHVLAATSYGIDVFCAVARRGNIWGCQFHPEKSGPVGLRIYDNFVNVI